VSGEHVNTAGKSSGAYGLLLRKGGIYSVQRYVLGKPIKPGENRSCVRCNKEFYVSDWYVKNGYGKYCSTDCYDRGLTELSQKIRKLFYSWRMGCLRRDHFKCVECGVKKNLEVHHIIPIVKIRKDYNINSMQDAKECDLFYDINNGKTLCVRCHQKSHGSET
jgi:hypothetical protein